MRLLQLHEYLSLLDGGASGDAINDTEASAYLDQAQQLWPTLGISPWHTHERNVEYVANCTATGTRLVHVSADWENCFLILVLRPGQQTADSYLLFDIGAEYQERWFICPSLGIDEAVSRELVHTAIPQLPGQEDPFAIVEAGNGTYIQAYADGDLFDVEYQLVSTSSHYALREAVTADVVIRLFLSYGFGKKEWAREFKWERMEL